MGNLFFAFFARAKSMIGSIKTAQNEGKAAFQTVKMCLFSKKKKKSKEMFGGFRKTPYLCNAFKNKGRLAQLV